MFSSLNVHFGKNGACFPQIRRLCAENTKSLGSRTQRWPHSTISKANSRLRTSQKSFFLHLQQGGHSKSDGPVRSHTRAPFSHGEVMDMEIGVLDQSFINKDPKLLIDHIQSVASGEASFFPTTLSLVYDRRIGKVFPKEDSPSTSLPEKSPGGQNVNTPNPFQFSSPASAVASSSTPGAGSSTTPTIVTPAPPPTREPAPPSTPTTWKLLKCARCGGNPKLRDLYDGLLCPWCPEKGKNGYGVKGRPYMRCSGCSQLRPKRVDTCTTSKCGARFL